MLAILPIGFETAVTAHETYSSKICSTYSPEKTFTQQHKLR
jgi:hypothetical protein